MPKKINNKFDAIDKSRDIILLISISMVLMLFLLSNPGYYSHDEWQRFDYYHQNGFLAYIIEHSKISAGASFGTPVRPVAFAVQGIHNLFFENFPFIVHLFSVANTITVSVIIYLGCMRFGLRRKTAFLAGILFSVCPLTTLATGWSAALMDQLYITFGLLTFFLADRYVIGKKSGLVLLPLISVSGMAAVLSKETGVILPASLLLLIAIAWQDVFSRKLRFLAALLAWAAPILLYLIFRISAIENSFGGATNDPYAASLVHIGQNLFVYWAYPFHPLVGEAHVLTLQPVWSIWGSFLIHCSLVAALALLYGLRGAFLYVFFYFLFLIPVLLIPNLGSHYLFASGISLSVAVASLLVSNNSLAKGLGAAMAVVLAWHGLGFQTQIYQNGRCMNQIVSSLEANHKSAGFPGEIYFTADWNAPTYILLRLIHDRNWVGDHNNINLQPPSTNGAAPGDALFLNLDQQCLLSEVQNGAISIEGFGPNSTFVGIVPNIQPDGSMGIWINLADTGGLGDAQVYFDGKPATLTVVGNKLITASIPPDMFFQPGKYQITLRQGSKDVVVPVGMFEVKSSN